MGDGPWLRLEAGVEVEIATATGIGTFVDMRLWARTDTINNAHMLGICSAKEMVLASFLIALEWMPKWARAGPSIVSFYHL